MLYGSWVLWHTEAEQLIGLSGSQRGIHQGRRCWVMRLSKARRPLQPTATQDVKWQHQDPWLLPNSRADEVLVLWSLLIQFALQRRTCRCMQRVVGSSPRRGWLSNLINVGKSMSINGYVENLWWPTKLEGKKKQKSHTVWVRPCDELASHPGCPLPCALCCQGCTAASPCPCTG